MARSRNQGQILLLGWKFARFLLGTMATKDAINSAVQSVGPESAKLFKTQYGLRRIVKLIAYA